MQEKQSDSLRTPRWELLAYAALALFYLVAPQVSLSLEVVNVVGPLALSMVLLLGAVRALRVEPAALWTGLLWLRISTAVYFGIGTVVHRYVNYETLLMIIGFFHATEEQIAICNLIVVVAILVILVTATLLAKSFPKQEAESTDRHGRLLLIIGVSCAVVGFFMKIFVALPLTLGALNPDAVPGIVMSLESFAQPGTFLVSLWVLRHAPGWLPFVLMGVALAMLIGFIRFIKAETILPLLMFSMALIYHRATMFRVAVCAVAIVALYQMVTDPVSHARGEIYARYGSLLSASFLERVEILRDYFVQDQANGVEGEGLQGSVARLAYVHAAAPAIYLYGQGIYGDTLADALTVFIPRSLWPEKPIYDHGTRYNQMVNGNAESSSWMGYFVEAYWNVGWFGLPIIMGFMGAAFFALGRYAQHVLTSESWVHFPIVFMGMYLGVRVDGSLVTEFAGVCVVALIYHNIANILSRWLHVFVALK